MAMAPPPAATTAATAGSTEVAPTPTGAPAGVPTSALAGSPSCAQPPVAPLAPQAPAASPQAALAQQQAEWEAASAAVEADAVLAKRVGGTSGRRINMLVSQVARVHAVVWEKAEECLVELEGARKANGDEGVRAACFALAKRLITQGEMLVDKQPGMAYALAGFALHVGAGEPGVWTALDAQLKAACCYCVPHHVRKPAGGTDDEWKVALGWRRRSPSAWEGKADYYARTAGFVYLYGALLQQRTCALFTPPAEEMQTRAVANPLGMAAAWRWLARVLNQRPQRVTATILLAFLKPSAHALAATYPRQLPKLLRFVAEVYVVRIAELLQKEDLPEERAALSNLTTWLEATRAELAARRPLQPPTDADMPAFKEPDNTNDAGDDSW